MKVKMFNDETAISYEATLDKLSKMQKGSLEYRRYVKDEVMSYCDECIKFEEQFEKQYDMKMQGYAKMLERAHLLPTQMLDVFKQESLTGHILHQSIIRFHLFKKYMAVITPENFKDVVVALVDLTPFSLSPVLYK